MQVFRERSDLFAAVLFFPSMFLTEFVDNNGSEPTFNLCSSVVSARVAMVFGSPQALAAVCSVSTATVLEHFTCGTTTGRCNPSICWTMETKASTP